MTVIPLVHSHTSAHDLQAVPHHQHGIVHTVFSSDIGPDDQQQHHHVGPSRVERGDLLSGSLLEQDPEVQELELSFLVAPDRKPQQGVILVASRDETVVLLHDNGLRGPPAQFPHLVIFSLDNRSPRAPPFLFLL
jgi:hypothetical protein